MKVGLTYNKYIIVEKSTNKVAFPDYLFVNYTHAIKFLQDFHKSFGINDIWEKYSVISLQTFLVSS
jgi:hypothetical protein